MTIFETWQIYVKQFGQWRSFGPITSHDEAELEVTRLKMAIKDGKERTLADPHCVPV